MRTWTRESLGPGLNAELGAVTDLPEPQLPRLSNGIMAALQEVAPRGRCGADVNAETHLARRKARRDHLLAKGALAGRGQQGAADTASEWAGWAGKSLPRWLAALGSWHQGRPGSLGIWARVLLITPLRPLGGTHFWGPQEWGRGAESRRGRGG